MDLSSDPTVQRHLALDARLVEAVRSLRVLSTVSWPASLQETFLDGWRRGNAALPAPLYEAVDHGGLHAELDAIAGELDGDHPLGEYLSRQVRCWHDTLSMLESMGTPGFTEASVRLFGSPADRLPGSTESNRDAASHFIEAAEELAGALDMADEPVELDAASLRDALQAELDACFVEDHIDVQLDPSLIAKAAAGATRIRLRDGARFTHYDHQQLLQHEAFIHSLTAINGRRQSRLHSLSLTAASSTATQEGLATFAELITGAIDIDRLKRISLRIEAIDRALSGADFIEVFRFFLDAGQSEIDSFRSAQRVFRGCPTGGGLAFTKDTVYLHGLLDVHTFFRWAFRQRRSGLLPLLFVGKLSLQDVLLLEPLFDAGIIDAPRYLPPWVRQPRGMAGILAFSLFANRIRLEAVDRDELRLRS